MQSGQSETQPNQWSAVETRQALERETELVDLLIDYAGTTFGDEAIAQAWLDFSGEDGAQEAEGIEDDDPINDIFLPWFVFNWMPDEAQTLAELFVATKGDEMAEADRALVAALGRRNLSFFEIKKTAPSGHVELRDLLLETDASIFDEGVAAEGAVGDVMFGAIRPGFGAVGSTFASAPFFLDHELVDEVETLRAEILKASNAATVGAAALATYQADVIGFFLDSLGDGEEDDGGES